MDAMSSQISNHIQMTIHSCPISTLGGAVDTMSSQISNHTQVAILSCLISILRVALGRNGFRIRRSSETIKTDTQQRRISLPRQGACTPVIPTGARTKRPSQTDAV